jgi:hypothetical protein
MTTEQEIVLLKAEIKQLKYALLTVLEVCGKDTPHYLANRIPTVKQSLIERGINVDAVIAGTL